MILLLGASGYVGNAIALQLRTRNIEYKTASIRFPLDEQQFVRLIINDGIDTIINCSGFVGVPNVDACENEDNKQKVLEGNAFLPASLASVCKKYQVSFIHISSGCIFNDANCERGEMPSTLFTEQSDHNFGFAAATSSWYSRSKSLAEHLIANDATICRLRIPFDDSTSPRNYLMKMINYDVLLNATNSFSYLPEFASNVVSIATNKKASQMQTFNMTQPGYLTTKQVVQMLENKNLVKGKMYFKNIEEFKKTTAAPRSNCVLDASKLVRHKFEATPIEDAMHVAISKLAFNLNK